MEIEFYAPVIILTLNRFDHFRKCVESLSQCKHADKTELVIGLDYPPNDKYVDGYVLIKEYIPSIKGFKKITILQHQKNLGPERNWEACEEYCFQKYDNYIFTEDDNVFSPAFLDFMNKSLQRFSQDTNVLSVSGYSHEMCYDQVENTYFCYNATAWGLGLWKSKKIDINRIFMTNEYFENKLHRVTQIFKLFVKAPGLIPMLLDLKDWKICDVKLSVYNIFEDKYQFRPTISLVRNCGQDGSGLHSGFSKAEKTQNMQDSEIFIFGDSIGSPNSFVCRKLYRENGMPNGKLARIKTKLWIISRVIKYRINENHIRSSKFLLKQV